MLALMLALLVKTRLNDFGHMALFVKADRTLSHSFLLADFAGTACCLQFGVSVIVHSAMMEATMLPLKLSCMDLPQIRVAFCCLQNMPLLNNALECDHKHSPFLSGRQSHVTNIVDVCRRSQPPRLPLNLRSTCFGSIKC